MPTSEPTIFPNVESAPSADDTNQMQALLAQIAEVTTATGERFFYDLARNLASALKARFVFISERPTPDAPFVRTIAFWMNPSFVENFEYDLEGTICQRAADGQIAFYRDDAAALFPADRLLVFWQVQSYLGIPILSATGEPLGHIAVLDTKPMPEGMQHLEILRIFTARAALELERRRLDRKVREAEAQAAEAVQGERQRLARDLHDTVIQSWYSLQLFVDATQRAAAEGEPDRIQASLAQIAETSRYSLKELRRIIGGLRPVPFEKLGLVGALQYHLDALRHATGVETDLRVEGDAHLAPEVDEALYFIVREALNNIQKYAQARHVVVRLASESPCKPLIRLLIEDDGVGFDLTALPLPRTDEHGIGMESMQERAEAVGGTFCVHTCPQGGTQIEVCVAEKGLGEKSGE